MNASLISALLLIACFFSSQQAGAGETKSYWDHGYSKNCNAERRTYMKTARVRAEAWCRSRGGVDRKRTNFVFIVDKGMKLGSSTQHFCEMKGTIVLL